MYINLKGKHILIWSIILILIILSIVFLSLKTNEITYGKKLIIEDNMINITNYYAEYDTTVVSNKNINTYSVKEWYKEGVGSRIEYLDYIGNVITVITNLNDCYISNAGNKAYILTENIYGTNNVLSLATYINIFNKEITCDCIKNIYEKEGKINLVFDVCNKENCMQNVGIKRLGITSFELIVTDNIPTIYTVYTGNKKEYASIVYNKFDTNMSVEDGVFSVSK